MHFDSALFLWFFGVVVAGFYAMARWPMARLVWLLLASYAFYGAWNLDLLWLIAASTLVDFGAGIGMGAAASLRARRVWLVISLLSNLGMLATFKYADFFLASLNAGAAMVGLGREFPLLHLLLPVGISFYTFQTLSYTIDVYRGKLKPIRNPVHFALYVAFFPQLVAGPIVRAVDFLPQLARPIRWEPSAFHLGALLMAIGYVKKTAVADYLAIHYVDRVFDNPELYSAVETLFAVYGYAIQIYCDFSGYSDIAIGAALMLGFRLPMNFDRPYAARSLQDFWRRWHISLSTWLRDYLYIPLGGNRGSAWGTHINLAITMLLGGLWHGASWNFVVWGALHGVALGVVRTWQRRYAREGAQPLRDALGIFVTFHYVCFCWVFFRTPTWEEAMAVLGRIVSGTAYTPNLSVGIAALVLGALALHLTPRRWERLWAGRFLSLPSWIQGLAYVMLAWVLSRIRTWDTAPFLYFQF